MKLLIRNLPRTTTEAELRTLFEAYGKVQSCTLVTDKETGMSKGFGFVVMPRPGDAKAARKNLNGKNLAGKIIRVKNAITKPDVTKPESVETDTAIPEGKEEKPESVDRQAAIEPVADKPNNERGTQDPVQNRQIWKK